MSALAGLPARPRRRLSPVLALTTLLATLLVLGSGAATVHLLTLPVSAPAVALPAAHRADGIGQDVTTSFGVIAVENVDPIAGPTAQQLSGVTHGIQDLVQAGDSQIQVSIALTNQLHRPIAYGPDNFRLLVGSGTAATTVKATTGNVHNGTLQPNAALEGHLSFVLKANGAAMRLQYTDPGRKAPIVIGLGTAPVSSAKAVAGHGGH
jgi:hypothetical protein